ncbi:MAG: 1-acyl-sn-glycerol-3-phosphate acyltransferase [Flavobacteriia bacterium]|nr:1-acyl-sn-glycerol-3-phosphate acyltransferase [Flavobacteriia bacterium]OJX39048.1 MAG: glycerol acyltransferase [Flavobacteriia bacterium 40-80]
MSKEKQLKIDVEQLISSKNPKLLKWLPRFVVSYLKRIIHQDEINDFIQRNGNKKNQEFCAAVAAEFELDITITDLERIPKTGPATVVMNHPLGGMDAIAFVHALADYRTDIKFVVNDLLLNLEGMKEMFVGVNKYGANSLASKKKVSELFDTDQLICIFPAGLVSRKKGGKVVDLEWKKTFLTMSRKSKRPIIPVYIDGKLSRFFYRFSNIRTFLGIKINLEMLYLVDELFKQRKKKIGFIVGEPVEIDFFDKSKSDKKWAEWMKQTVYQLGENR